MVLPRRADGVIDGADWDTVMDAAETRLGADLVRTRDATTLAAAAVTFAVAGAYTTFIELTGDVGANVIATITGAVVGQMLVLQFVDALIQITDNNAHAADSVDLSAAFTSADDTILTLIYDGTSWYETSRSVN